MNDLSNRRHIPADVKRMLLRLGSYIPAPELSIASGLSGRTLRRINRLWETRGIVARTSIDIGRPRKLRPLDVEVRNN
jgi:hypothetical protein